MENNLNIRRVPVSKLNPAAYNPRKDLKPGDPAYAKLARSLGTFGLVEPIVWNERTGNVVGGHQRLKILIAKGVTETDVSVVNLSEDDEKLLNVSLNKNVGEWDEAGLAALLKELSDNAAVDVEETGFDAAELDRLLSDLAQKTGDFHLPGMDGHVDNFFDEGVQSAAEPPAAADDKDAARENAEEKDDGGQAEGQSVTVFGLDPAGVDTLTAFLDENGFAYRLHEAGGA